MNFQFVDNNPDYWDFIRLLRSDDRVQTGFIEQVKITQEQQSRYMAKYNDNYWICLVNGQPAGFIGEIDGDIRVAVHPNYQKIGVGKFLVERLMELRPNSFAQIKIENEASLKLFKSCGFKEKFVILTREAK